MQEAPALSDVFGDFAQGDINCRQLPSQKLVVKNTFYDVQDDLDDVERRTLRRVASDSELSAVSLSSVSLGGSALSTPSNTIDKALRPGSSSGFSGSELWWGEIPQHRQ